MNPDLALSIALDAAREAGEILKKRFRKPLHVQTKASRRDLVTDVDHATQEVIVKTIQKQYKDHRFLTEEIGTEKLGNPSSPYLWVIDPLDGTKNYVHGKERCGTMIALLQARHPEFAEGQRATVMVRQAHHDTGHDTLLAVTLNPFTSELATAVRGKGTFINGKPASLRKTRDLLDAILATNTMRERCIENGVCRPVFPLCGDIHNYGAAIEEFAAILRGENDGIFFFNTNPWDVLPGFLLVEEAGGAVRLEPNEPENPRGGVRGVACTKPIFEELCKFVWRQ